MTAAAGTTRGHVEIGADRVRFGWTGGREPRTAAARTRRRPQGENRLPEVIEGVAVASGIEGTDTPTRAV